MTFDKILEQVITLLKRQGRISYSALRRRFDLDDAYLEDLKDELLFTHPVVDEGGRGLVWTSEADVMPSQTNQAEPQPTSQQSRLAQADSTSAEPPTPDAERRQLTVMFCDLVDSTKLSGQLDPEDLRDVIRAYQSTCAEVIERYDGYIAQHLGDGLMVYFGWPQAHEDDAQRAVHAGLGILEAMQELNARLEKEKSIRLAVRAGIHTGLVVVGEIGQGASHEHLALGETPNIASRLEGMAEPDTIAISADTHQLVQGYFDCDDLGLHTLKGVNEPKPVYRVMGASGLETRFLAATTKGLTALVGREEEIALLVKRWMQAQAGEGQVVLLSGEAGIGKSRITEALREQIANEPHLDMHYQCSPYHTNTAFYPITEQFAFAAGFTRHSTPREKLDKLEAHLRQVGLAVPEVAPLFADALSIPTAGRYPPLDITPQRQKERTIDALIERLLTAAKQRPVLFIAEDLHWSDPSSLEAIERIIAQLADARVLMVCTYRPDFGVPWGLDGPITTFSLNRLSRSQTTALIDAVAAGKSLPREVIEQIVSKSDGVPLYVEELTKHVLESGLLDDKEDHYDLKAPLPSLTIPVTLRDALTARLDRLPEAREVAQLGAVLGREFSYPMLQSLTRLDDPTLQARLMQLVEAELVYQRGRPPRAAYVFKHALIQDAAYASLLRSTRQQVHQHVAQLLETRFPELVETQPELVAHHYTEAGCTEQAIAYWQRAGQQAAQNSAHQETVSHLTQGLALLVTQPDTPERTQQELALQMALGPAFMVLKGFGHPEVEHAYVRARALCQQLGESPALFPVLWGLWRCYRARGAIQTARELGEQLLSLAEHQEDPTLRLAAHAALGSTLYHLGEFVPARLHLEQGIAQHTIQPHNRADARYGQDPGGQCYHFLALTLWSLGYPEQALQRSHEARNLAQALGHLATQVFSLWVAGWLRQFRREVPEAQALAETTIAVSAEQGNALYLAYATALHGWTLCQQGQHEEGLAQQHQGLAALRAAGAEVSRPLVLTLLAEAYGTVAQADQGLSLLAEARTIIDQNGQHYAEAECHRLEGELRLRQAEPEVEQAALCFHQALNIARRQQAKSWELRAATSLARLWQSQGKGQEAYDLLEPVYGWFSEGFDTADLKDAKALLQELEG